MIDNQTDQGVTVQPMPMPAWAIDVLTEAKAAGRSDLIVLPHTVRDGRGEYRAADLPAVKALRAAGVRIDWAHEEAERTFTSTFGAAQDALAISVFVAQALGEESVVLVARWLLARMRHMLTGQRSHESRPQPVVEVSRLTVYEDRTEIEGLRISGADERMIVEAFMSLLRGDPPSN